MKLFRDEDGQMLVMTALTMLVLLGFVALATDVGVFFHTRRQMQTAADAAATAGAMDILNNDTGAVTADANRAAANNGFSTTNGSVITVNTPPIDGYHQVAGNVEVTIQQPSPTFFMRLFGFNTMNISTRAVAGPYGYRKNCIYLMDPTDYDLKVQGSTKIFSPNCGIYINSDNPNSVVFPGAGSGLTVTAPYVLTVGGGPSSVGGAPIYTGASLESAPNVQSVGIVPSPSTCSTTIGSLPSPSYPAGSTIEGGNGVVCFTGTNASVDGYTLQNGVFIFQNGVTLGTTTVTNGTIELYGGTLNQNNYNLTMTAPASRTETFGGVSFNGVSLLVPTANTSYTSVPCKNSQPGKGHAGGTLQIQFGSSTMGSPSSGLDGYIVAPNEDLFMQDQGGGVQASGIYAACMDVNSFLSITSYDAANPLTTPNRVVTLLE